MNADLDGFACMEGGDRYLNAPARRYRRPPSLFRFGVLHLMQRTNLGGMEQAAIKVMRNLRNSGRFAFRIGTPQAFGQGARLVRRLDREAQEFDCRGTFGSRDSGLFRDWVTRQAKSSDLLWVTGSCTASLAAIRGSQAPKILSQPHLHAGPFGSWLRWRAFYEFLGRQLDAVVFPTEFTRAEAVAIAPWLAPRASVIHDGVEPSHLDEARRIAMRRDARRCLNLPENALVVGNAGHFVQRKRFDVFLEVAARVHARRPDSIFLLCGSGPQEADLRRKAQSLGLGDAVRFEGWVESMTLYYKAMDVLLFNSDGEAFARVPLEAANWGALIVASVRYGGLREFIQDGVNGVLLTEHDREALAEAVLGLVDSETAQAMRVAASRTIHESYSISRSARLTERLFERLCTASFTVKGYA